MLLWEESITQDRHKAKLSLLQATHTEDYWRPSTHLEAFLEGIDAEVEEYLPGLFLLLQFLPDAVQPVVDVDPQTRQNLLLGDIQGLRVAITSTSASRTMCVCEAWMPLRLLVSQSKAKISVSYSLTVIAMLSLSSGEVCIII